MPWTLPREQAGSPLWPDSWPGWKGCIGSVLRVALMGKRTDGTGLLLEKGPEMGRRVQKAPCYVLEKRACVLSSRTASAQAAGDPPPSWPGMEETAPSPRDA